MLKRRLIYITQRDAEVLAQKWLKEVLESPYTPTYKTFSQTELLERAKKVYLQMENWLETEGEAANQEVSDYYLKLGQKRKKEGFAVEEVVAAILLTKKVLWEYVVSKGLPTSSFELYTALDVNNQVVYYYDLAIYYCICGYLEAETGRKCVPV